MHLFGKEEHLKIDKLVAISCLAIRYAAKTVMQRLERLSEGSFGGRNRQTAHEVDTAGLSIGQRSHLGKLKKGLCVLREVTEG